MYGRRLGRPQAPVAEGGPGGFSDGGNRRDWFPGAWGLRAAYAPPESGVILIIALILITGVCVKSSFDPGLIYSSKRYSFWEKSRQARPKKTAVTIKSVATAASGELGSSLKRRKANLPPVVTVPPGSSDFR